MKILVSVTAAIALALVSAQEAASDNAAFQVGEKLTYTIHWGPLSVGRATLEVKGIEKVDGHDCYHLVAEAKTTGLGDLLFRVRSTAESWLDVKGLFTRKYAEDRTEGKSRYCDEIIYDYERKQTIVKNRDTGKEERHPLECEVLDAVSLLYAARVQPLKLESASTFTVNTGDTNYQVTIKPDEKRDLKVRATGKVPALRVELSPTLKIVAENKGRAWFWVSDDGRHLPLLAYSKMKIGSARLELVEIEPKKEAPKVEAQPKTNFGPSKKVSP